MKTIRTPEKRKKFLDALAEMPNVARACRKANIGRSAAYAWRNDVEDFAKDWADAERDAMNALEEAMWDRATREEAPSDTLAIFLSKAHAPEKYRERYTVDSNIKGSLTVSTKPEDLTDEQLAAVIAGEDSG